MQLSMMPWLSWFLLGLGREGGGPCMSKNGHHSLFWYNSQWNQSCGGQFNWHKKSQDRFQARFRAETQANFSTVFSILHLGPIFGPIFGSKFMSIELTPWCHQIMFRNQMGNPVELLLRHPSRWKVLQIFTLQLVHFREPLAHASRVENWVGHLGFLSSLDTMYFALSPNKGPFLQG